MTSAINLNDINEIIWYNTNSKGALDYPDTSSWLELWRRNKSRFAASFPGPNLIWKYPEPISIKTPIVEQERQLFKYIDSVQKELGDDAASLLLCNFQSFFDNKVTIPLLTYNVSRGDRLLRSLRKFSTDFSKVRKMQDLGSTLIQQKKLHGYLHFSIHPLDFLSMSVNNSNWRSCHSLDGSYRGGIANLLTDSTTIMAYLLTSEDQVPLTYFPSQIKWNDKKWRMLIHITDHCVYYSKQYPFHNSTLLSTVASVISENSARIFPGVKPCQFLEISPVKYTTENFLSEITVHNKHYPSIDVFKYNNLYNGYKDLYNQPDGLIYAAYTKPADQLTLEDLSIEIGHDVRDPYDPEYPLMIHNDFVNK